LGGGDCEPGDWVRMGIDNMTEEARTLALVLLKRHKQICRAYRAKPDAVTDRMIQESVIFYGDLCETAGVSFLTHGVGRFLDEIGEWCEEHGWPLLNSLAVNRETGMPGFGYDGAHGGDLLLWPNQVRRCIAFRRYPETVAD